MKPFYQIGQLAKLASVPVETIRFYEAKKLLHAPARSAGNYRRYGPEHLERLLFIRHCRALDMSLAEVRRLLKVKDSPDTSCEDANALIDEHIAHVTGRLTELKKLQRQLLRLRERCDEKRIGTGCGILTTLADTTTSAVASSNTTHRRATAGCH